MAQLTNTESLTFSTLWANPADDKQIGDIFLNPPPTTHTHTHTHTHARPFHIHHRPPPPPPPYPHTHKTIRFDIHWRQFA